MLTLSFDTSQEVTVVALADGAELLAGHRINGRAQLVLDGVDFVLGTAGRTLGDVERIAVGVGPGSFTGVRVGVATARGLADALDVPLAALPTLAALAQPLAERTGDTVWASADARREQRFLRSYRWISGIAGFLMVPEGDLCAVPVGEVDAVVGDAPVADGEVTPTGLVAVAAGLTYGEIADVLPTYGRDPDAVPASR